MDPLPSCLIRTVPTDRPGERSFIVLVADSVLRADALPAPGVTYAGWALPSRPRSFEAWGAYLYVEDVEAPEGYAGFLFVKPDGAADAATGLTPEQSTPFITFYSTRDYEWPAVLHALPEFTLDDQYLVSATYGDLAGQFEGRVLVPRMYVDDQYFTPAARVATVFKHEIFLSAIPWPKSALTHPTPVPTAVRLEMPGLGVWQLPPCLHPEVRTEELLPEVHYRLVRTDGGSTVVSEAPAPDLPDQVFPATNFLNWRDHVESDEVVRAPGGKYRRERVTALVPARGARRERNG